LPSTQFLYPPPLLFNDTPTTYLYTLSLHDALPILASSPGRTPLAVVDLSDVAEARLTRRPSGEAEVDRVLGGGWVAGSADGASGDRKSTRLNSSHVKISYAVFCLKKKKTIKISIG